MKVAIIILHFGKLKTTQDCIKSIFRIEKTFSRIILVNNDQQVLRRSDFASGGTMTIINNPRNVGFAKGVNIGIAKALEEDVDAVLLLNNDTILSQPFLSQLTKDVKGPIGIVSPALQFEKNKNTFYDLGGYINMAIGKTRHENREKIISKVLVYPDYVSGCCMLVKKEVFDKIGKFDEQFFLYYEDVDFCLRAKKAGFEIAIDPRLVVYHALTKAAGKTSKISLYHQTRSALLFGEKYFGYKPQRIIHSIFILLQSFLFFKNSPSTGIAAFQAIKDSWLRT